MKHPLQVNTEKQREQTEQRGLEEGKKWRGWIAEEKGENRIRKDDMDNRDKTEVWYKGK